MVPGTFSYQIDSEIHLEPREALVLTGFEALAVDLGIVGFGGIGIASDAIAELSAEHLVDGDVVGFPGEIPERHLDAAHSASLPGMARRTV